MTASTGYEMIVALKRELLQPNVQSLRHSFFMLVTWAPHILVRANISQPSVATEACVQWDQSAVPEPIR